MSKLGIGLCLLLRALIAVCHEDDSIIKQLLDRVETLERRDLESAVRQKEMEKKVQLYFELTERLRTELKEKDNVIDELKKSLMGFENVVRHLRDVEQGKTSSPYKMSDEAKVKEETSEILNENASSTSHKVGQQHFSMFADKKNGSNSISSTRRLIVNQGETVAFHAVNTQGEIPHIGIGQNILFDKVMLNVNNGFHPLHGVFIAPTAGLYIFSTSALSFNGQTTALFATDLVKNGDILARAYGHGDSGKHDQGSVTAVVQLIAGDEVWVRLSCCADDSLYGGYYTSFTGALLSAF